MRFAELLMVLIILFLAAPVPFLFNPENDPAEQVWEYESSIPLTGLKNETLVEGHRGLFAGYVAEKEHILAFKKDGNAFVRITFPMDGARIFEDADENTAKAIVYRQKKRIIGFLDGNFQQRVDLHVPPGTVSRDMDLE